MSENNTPGNLETTFVVVGPQFSATAVPVTETIWSDLDNDFNNFSGHSLIASFAFQDDWPTWEMHPHGDEVVCLISGDVEMILDAEQGQQTVRLQEPGSFVVVPKGTWHTARVFAPSNMLFVTPGEGTENREQPGRPDV